MAFTNIPIDVLNSNDKKWLDTSMLAIISFLPIPTPFAMFYLKKERKRRENRTSPH